MLVKCAGELREAWQSTIKAMCVNFTSPCQPFSTQGRMAALLKSTCAGWARGRPAQVESKRGGQRAVAPVGERRYNQAPVEAHVLVAVCEGTYLAQS